MRQNEQGEISMDKLKQMRQEMEAMQYVLQQLIIEIDTMIEQYEDDGK